MTNEEAATWRDSFSTEGVYPWVTAGSDLEGYFCSAKYLAALYDVTEDVAEEWRRQAAITIGGAKKHFFEKRKKIVYALWPDGGSPAAEGLWESAGGQTPTTVKGKKLHKALKQIVKNAGKDDKLLDAFAIPDNFVVAEDLKEILETAIKLG